LLALCLLVGIYYFLPPLKGEDTSVEVHISETLKTYVKIFKDPMFLTFGLAGSLTYASLFAYISGSSHVYIDIFGFSAKYYGWALGVNAAGLIFGNQINHVLLKKYSAKKITEITFICLCGLIIVLLIFIGFSQFTSFVFIIFIFLFISLLGILNPNTMALALSPFRNKAGRASALIGSMQMGISALMSVIVSWLGSDSVFPMVACMTFCAFCGLIMVRVYLKQIETAV
jgi:DHA1 family bicyclomycin/chloramphenicol resistance-like MFS transporter